MMSGREAGTQGPGGRQGTTGHSDKYEATQLLERTKMIYHLKEDSLLEYIWMKYIWMQPHTCGLHLRHGKHVGRAR